MTEQNPLTKATVDPNPVRQFEKWFQELPGAGVNEQDSISMTLATATKDALPCVGIESKSADWQPRGTGEAIRRIQSQVRRQCSASTALGWLSRKARSDRVLARPRKSSARSAEIYVAGRRQLV